ncbi:MAG: PstS family phosphate ABC transporter substrate-binding protein [Leptolyngbyaceae cyanobacterium SM1_1_3]|nr:PstS family phosphate ABC transporter substrate-binding protein [Leptolyngbyaceae cyanobacterium SM1_1_3]NJO08974.1 PstS family phosphate ABC transporter substrate-binding protein [Leptolyngbyaceae cyanobacterium SL_1_1]
MRLAYSVSLVALLAGLAACGGETATAPEGDATDTASTEAGSDLSGTIAVDGSSTVFPISEAMAEEFQRANPDVQITVGASGTGGGFEKFCNGETQISDASREVKPEEIANCEANGIEMIELPVATDALTVVVNPENDWAQCLTIEQLNTVWAPEAEGTVDNWNQVDPSFPDAPLVLYGPGTDSGTFDYFTEIVNGEEGASRSDYTASEDDNVLVQGVVGDTNALGYFGYAYYFENQDSMKAVAVDAGSGCVEPTEENVLGGTYEPLSRPLRIYVSKQAMEENEAVKAFVDFYLDPANKELVAGTGYVPLADDQYSEAQTKFESGEVKTAE